jgi:hypothetical protein
VSAWSFCTARLTLLRCPMDSFVLIQSPATTVAVLNSQASPCFLKSFRGNAETIKNRGLKQWIALAQSLIFMPRVVRGEADQPAGDEFQPRLPPVFNGLQIGGTRCPAHSTVKFGLAPKAFGDSRVDRWRLFRERHFCGCGIVGTDLAVRRGPRLG